MNRTTALTTGILAACAFAQTAGASEAGSLRSRVDEVIAPLMVKHGIPGMAVAIVTQDGRHVFNYGVASRQTGKPVVDDTLFEVGSVSKTFTATLASYAAVKGNLRLSDSVAEHVPMLKGSDIGDVPLATLATHTPGGMPLQFPDGIGTDAQMMQYFKDWRSSYEPGTVRTYANPSIGLLGMIAARSMGRAFIDIMQAEILPELAMQHTFLIVPPEEQIHYAQGYTRKDVPVRLSSGVLAAEAYGVRTTATDLARFVEANMEMSDIATDLQDAITETHVAAFAVGAMRQALIWEKYDYPAGLEDLVTGNASTMSLEPHPVMPLDPSIRTPREVWINKTGSTNGFGAYVAFIPSAKLGIVLLANRNYPNEARVTAAYNILSGLEDGASGD